VPGALVLTFYFREGAASYEAQFVVVTEACSWQMCYHVTVIPPSRIRELSGKLDPTLHIDKLNR